MTLNSVTLAIIAVLNMVVGVCITLILQRVLRHPPPEFFFWLFCSMGLLQAANNAPLTASFFLGVCLCAALPIVTRKNRE